ncbi:SEC-C metal-binding domain-containing protein [Actinophytocola gossypii]|uniref:SEC-C domain-containing protein n=1 Tax=Actinophytocola gossypii TaxID=2812003 RepID=A0ABT2J3H6_9PSEU|nr:SEC-C metal-binding domain-containing protein [Actinophytocola gossypii]MCT2582405.1 SEC-C domain-containing protein [Actinophytocola gossypii]
MRGARVSGDDIDFAVRDAIDQGSPDATIDRLMAAVHDAALRGPEFSVAHAMLTVSELQLRYGRAPEAEATLRLAVSDDVHDELGEPRAYLAALLADTGRGEEAAREFAKLVDLGRAGATEHQLYAEALEAAGDFEAAVRVYTAGEALASGRLAAQLHKAADRARDGGASRTPASVASVPPTVLFWPRSDHARAVATWPTLKDDLGADWDEHRTTVERTLARVQDPTYGVADFDAFNARTRGLPPIGTTLSGYLRTLPVAGTWPPDLSAACWCGSGQRYKRCCRTRGLAG